MAHIDILGIDIFRNGPETGGFYINRLSSHLTQSHHHINRPHKHDSYAVILFTGGSGIHEIEFTSFDVRPGAIFFLSPGQTHNWDLSGDAEGFVLFHSSGYFNALYAALNTEDFAFYAGRIPAATYLSGKDRDAIAAKFAGMIHEHAAPGRKSHYMVLSLLTEIYILCERLFDTSAGTPVAHNAYQLTFSRFQELLEKNYTEVKSAQWYADRLNITAKHLNRINKTLVDQSTSELIAARIVLEAKRLLAHTSLNINEIAGELGYSDTAYFSKLFRRHVGVSPSQFVSRYSKLPTM